MAVRSIASLEIYAFIAFMTTMIMVVATENDIPVGEVLMDDRPVILRGYDGILQCRVRGEPLAVFWEKGPDLASATNLVSWHPFTGGIRVPSYGIGKYNLTEDFSLVIHDVEDDDAGRYICRLSDFRGYELSNHTVATVKVPPQEPFPAIDQCPSGSPGGGENPCTLKTEIGDTTELTCRARGAPRDVISLSWTLRGRTISNQEPQRSANPDDETEDLTLTIAAMPSADPYFCTAAILPATIRGNATASVIVKPAPITTTTNATDLFIGDPGSRSLGKGMVWI
nr:obscurin-like protein 1 [Lytechinus pictus]